MARDGVDLGYITKGWEDPGFRIGQQVTLEGDGVRMYRERSGQVRDFCASQLMVLWELPEGDKVALDVSIPIYEGGLNEETLAGALRNLSACVNGVRDIVFR